ncbi:MAG: hypothetical protein EBT03_07895 [Betaproteobacteria bacterium]|nr:hypothetical protein [Betaproteobacteria bacterium]
MTPEETVLLRVLDALVRFDGDVVDVVDHALGKGWEREIAQARGQEERLAIFRRRLKLLAVSREN